MAAAAAAAAAAAGRVLNRTCQGFWSRTKGRPGVASAKAMLSAHSLLRDIIGPALGEQSRKRKSWLIATELRLTHSRRRTKSLTHPYVDSAKLKRELLTAAPPEDRLLEYAVGQGAEAGLDRSYQFRASRVIW